MSSWTFTDSTTSILKPKGSNCLCTCAISASSQTWPGILDTNSRAVARSLHGVLRHLPEEALGDFAQVKTILDKEAPLEDLPSALSDMVSCLAEIAHETKGYDLPELNEPEEGEEKA